MRDTTKVQDLDRKYIPYHWEEDYTRVGQTVFAIEYDMLNVIDVADDYPSMSMKEIIKVIESEGGKVDEYGNISRGSAKYVFAKEDNSEFVKIDGSLFGRTGVAHRDMRALVLRAAVKFLGKHFAEAFFWVLEEKEKRDIKYETSTMVKFTRKAFFEMLEKYHYYVDADGTIKYSNSGLTSVRKFKK